MSAPRDSLSQRRLATLASLLLLSGFVVALVVARVVYTGTLVYGNLVWNLFLAWIPFVLALLVYDGHRRRAGRLPLAIGATLWLLFFPNAPYIVTDLKWLRDWGGAPIWFDVVLVTTAAWAGLALGFISLYLMQAVARRVVGTVNSWLAVLAVLGLSSFGIYLGRFERWNSWDIFFEPRLLLADVGRRVADPAAYPKTLAVTALFTFFLALTYLVFYSFARLGLGERAERDAR